MSPGRVVGNLTRISGSHVVGPVCSRKQGADPAEVQVHFCGSCQGKRIAHTIGTIFFCVPYGIKVHRDAGFEGDIRDVMTLSYRGELGELFVSSSMNPSG